MAHNLGVVADHQGQRDGREGKNHHPTVHQERLLSQDYYVTRKVKEGLIAVEIERKKESKNEIIADYLNTVYSGNDAYGVEAAETYFN